MRTAMVLAAGRGTRLAPLTDSRAKPLVPVGDRPALAHIVDRLRASGVERIAVNAHHRAADVSDFARRQGGVVVSEERELLGTAGGIAKMNELVAPGDVIVWAGDVIASPDLLGLLEAHAASPAEATLAVLPRPRGQGNVGIGAVGRIVRLRGERAGAESDEVAGGYFIGVQVLGARLRERLPALGCLVGDGYIPSLRRGETLRAVRYGGPFADIGTCADYLAANLEWLAVQSASSGSTESWVGPGARVDAAVTLNRSVVGAGASIRGAGPVTRCVLWPGARVGAPLSDAVVAGDLVVRVGR